MAPWLAEHHCAAGGCWLNGWSLSCIFSDAACLQFRTFRQEMALMMPTPDVAMLCTSAVTIVIALSMTMVLAEGVAMVLALVMTMAMVTVLLGVIHMPAAEPCASAQRDECNQDDSKAKPLHGYVCQTV